MGGFFALQALSNGSLLFAFPVIIGVALLIRARRSDAAHMWADLAAFLLGAGALALVYAVPAAVNPMCMGAAGGGPTDCTINYYAVAITALYGVCLVVGTLLVVRVLRRPSAPVAFAGGRAS